MSKVALIIIYNHNYEKNIDVLEEIYSKRFKNIYHLMPFYNGTKENVIPVYENSYYFQGYVAQGFNRYFKLEYEHYFFIADDLILNPIINEENYTEYLKLDKNTSFIPRLDTMRDYWKIYNIKPKEAYFYKIELRGVEAKKQLPDYDVAQKALAMHGIEIKPLHFHQIVRKPHNPILYLIYMFRRLMNINKKYHLPYPLTSSYADIFVVDSSTIKQFCHYSGVFAATRLWIEVGLPTALGLSAKKINVESDLKLQGRALWSKEDLTVLDKYNNSLELLLEDFPSNYLYLHPIKLSKWNRKL